HNILSLIDHPSRMHACLWLRDHQRMWQFYVPNVDSVARVPSVVWSRCELPDEETSRMWLAHVDPPSEIRAFRSVVLATTGVIEELIDSTMAETDVTPITFTQLTHMVPQLAQMNGQDRQFLEAALNILTAVEASADASVASTSATRAALLRQVSDAHSDIQRACRRLIGAEFTSAIRGQSAGSQSNAAVKAKNEGRR
ncbi:MAG: hypothetical protein EBS41_07300, partial [Actinobacteria bacterium]|nr:hypothetical protein [Actinomycetota bacterium]